METDKIILLLVSGMVLILVTYNLIRLYFVLGKEQIAERKQEKRKEKAKDHKYTKEELIKYANEKLNLVVINNDILNTVNDFIADNDNLGGATIHTFVDTLAHTYFREPFGIGQNTLVQ